MTPLEYNRQLPAPGDYARSWKIPTTMDPETEVSVPGWIVGMPGWGRQSVKVSEVLRDLRTALQSRINARAGFQPREPREEEYRLRRDAWAIRDHFTKRVRIHSFDTLTARKRFSHLIASRDD